MESQRKAFIGKDQLARMVLRLPSKGGAFCSSFQAKGAASQTQHGNGHKIGSVATGRIQMIPGKFLPCKI